MQIHTKKKPKTKTQNKTKQNKNKTKTKKPFKLFKGHANMLFCLSNRQYARVIVDLKFCTAVDWLCLKEEEWNCFIQMMHHPRNLDFKFQLIRSNRLDARKDTLTVYDYRKSLFHACLNDSFFRL